MKMKTFFLLFILGIFINISVFATVASSSDIYDGIDISNWQGAIDFNDVKNSNIEVIYIKSSQGDNIVDSYFRINYTLAKAAGLKVGFYHYLTARNEEEAIRQAEFFCSVISNTSPDCKLAMDFESFGDLSIDEINQISEVFLERVKEISKKEVIIYSDESNARNVFNKNLAGKYPLWIAEYGVEEVQETNWKYWEGFQYTNRGVISGIEGYVDKDKFTSDIFLSNSSASIAIEETGNKENYNQDVTYTVKKGNTLSCIANEYNTTVRELVKLNNINNPNLIYPNEILYVPIRVEKSLNYSNDLGHDLYLIEKGDTLTSIAEKFNTTVMKIAKLNDIKNINLIYAGEYLRIKNED